MRPDEFMVGLGDYGNAVDVAFSEGEGDARRRVAVRLDVDTARRLGVALMGKTGGTDIAPNLTGAMTSGADDA